jgi:putative membrane protein
MRDETIRLKAHFDPRLQLYWTLLAAIIGAFTCIGLLWVPFQLMINRKRYESLECELTERSLNIRMGFLFRTEKTIPLDKIQDLSLHEGPLLRHLGLASLKVETAGGGSAQGVADATLTGVMDAIEFRDAVLDQRDQVTQTGGAAPPVVASTGSSEDVLAEIRDSVRNIQKLLEQRQDGEG